MEDNLTNRQLYVRKILAAYRRTPGTTGAVRREDRLLAAQLYQRGVPLSAVENAMLLATARRLSRPPGSTPLGPIRSLHYFLALIDQVLDLHPSPDYFHYLRQTIQRFDRTSRTR